MRLAILTSVIITIGYIYAFIFTYIVLNSSFLQKRRIQKKRVSAKVIWHRTPLILFNMSIILALSTSVVFFLSKCFSSDLPTIATFFIQMFFLIFVDDIYFYFYHLSLHKSKFLYRHIHARHHRASAPYPLEFLYVHPLEHLFGSIGAIIGFIGLYYLYGSINIYIFWSYYLVRTLHETDVHSGINSFILNWIPFYGSTQHHDAHHAHLHGNYASTFSLWDWIFHTKIKDPNISLNQEKHIPLSDGKTLEKREDSFFDKTVKEGD